jgi:hypothetical protein
LPVYTSKRFSGFTLTSLIIGIVIVGLVGWGVRSFFFFSIQRGTAFYQVVDSFPVSGKPTPYPWARLNHTILILDNNILESIFVLTAKDTPPYQDVKIEVSFDDPYTYSKDESAGHILEGNRTWSGKFGVDLQINQTITIYTKIRFDFDAKYCVSGQMLSYRENGSSEGYGTVYYIRVEQGTIVKVNDRSGEPPPSIEGEVVEIHP